MEADALEKPKADPDKPIVHGDPENGFIVEHHDGETHRTHGCMAGSEDEAIDAAKQKWRGDDGGAERGGDGEERDDIAAEIADLRTRLDAFETRLTELEHPATDVEDAGHSMTMSQAPPAPASGYPGALRPSPDEPSLGDQLEQQRANRVASDPAIDEEYEAFRRERAARNKPGTSPPPA